MKRMAGCLLMTFFVLGAVASAAPARCPHRRLIRPNRGIDATSSYTQHRVPFSIEQWRVAQLLDTGGWVSPANAYADFDGDGQVDLATIPVVPGNLPRTPRIVSLGSPLEDITDRVVEGPLPEFRYGQRALVADFNKDGKPDLYLASAYFFDQGANALLLSAPDGKLHWDQALSALEGAGFHQAASAADIDNDGDVDIFVGQDGYSGRAAYFLINDGQGHFSLDTARVPATLGQRALSAGELIDVDRDGYLDLLVGSNDSGFPDAWPTRVYWGGPFGFANARETVLPTVSGFGVVLDVDADDLDGDGRKEIVVTRTSPSFQGYYFQVLVPTRRRQFRDESVDRIIGDPSTWPGSLINWAPITRIRLADIDGDGSRDVIVDDRGLGLGWVNDGTGHFTFQAP